MVKRVAQFLWSSREQLFKYVVVGGIGVVLDVGSLKFLKEVIGWSAVLSVVVNQVFLIAYGFLLNKYWSFRNKEMPHKQFVRYMVLVIGNYIFSVATMFLFHERLGYNYLIVRIASIACMTTWNFALYKNWVYRSEGSSELTVLIS